MAIRDIRVVPDPVLRTPCDPITDITPAIRRLVDDLLDTVNDPGRAGVSANQIGVSLRALLIIINGFTIRQQKACQFLASRYSPYILAFCSFIWSSCMYSS